MSKTTIRQRELLYHLHQTGQTYPQLACQQGLSRECVRYWCRKQRAGHSAQTVHPARQMLERFDPKVRYVILRLRLAHPRWGPDSLSLHLPKRPSLRGLSLPSRAQIGRYLHQFERFRRTPQLREKRIKSGPTTACHQRWQIDFKVLIPLGGQKVQLFCMTDEFSGTCIGAQVFPNPTTHPRLLDVVSFIRSCGNYWGWLPDEIQTDGESILTGRTGKHFFPTRFTLWLAGLGIQQWVIPAGRPTVNAEVERCHRTVRDYALAGQENLPYQEVNTILEQSVHELIYEFPSRGKRCEGHAHVEAYPDLLALRRPYHSALEREYFSLQKVDAFLAEKRWLRKVEANGVFILGEQRPYSIGRKYAGQLVLVGFDPHDRQFVVYQVDEATLEPLCELMRKPARGLELDDFILATEPLASVPVQLPLLFQWNEGVNVNEHFGV